MDKFPKNRDRTQIVDILAQWGEDQDEDTRDARLVNSIQQLLMQTRAEAFGWMHCHCCFSLQDGHDPRTESIPNAIATGMYELSSNATRHNEGGREADDPPVTMRSETAHGTRGQVKDLTCGKIDMSQ